MGRVTVGYPRVGTNCALCHATQCRTEPDAGPVIVAAGGSNTADIQGLLEFFSRAATVSALSSARRVKDVPPQASQTPGRFGCLNLSW